MDYVNLLVIYSNIVKIKKKNIPNVIEGGRKAQAQSQTGVWAPGARALQGGI